jgi:hypothetical protein
LSLYKSHNRGGNSVSLALARHISKNFKISFEKIRHMAKVHKSNKFVDMKKLPPSDDYIAFMLYGGNEGKNWSTETIGKMDDFDSKNLSYFSEAVTFPYTSLKDANPALKGIDPPISLEQANAIARQADAIGSDKEKNGWAIAISNFKKTHTIKDGKWVKKENEAENSNVKENKIMEDEEKKTEEMAVEEEKKEESPEEEKKETPEDRHKEEVEKKEMSLDANLDVAAILAMLADETEGYKEVVEAEFAKPEGEKNFAKVCEAMFAKMCKMAEKIAKMEAEGNSYMAENKQLKEFKADIDAKEFKFQVDSTLKEIETGVEIPKEELFAMREESANFSLENITTWKNAVKARAFTFAAKGKKEEVNEKRYGLPWGSVEENKKKSLWD